MTKNIGRFDQVLRIGISMGFIYVGFIDESIIDDSFSAMAVGIFGIINLFVATVRFCPLYLAISVNTCHHEGK